MIKKNVTRASNQDIFFGYGPLATSRECIDEPSGSGAMELVRMIKKN
jgi:hypothetical protein